MQCVCMQPAASLHYAISRSIFSAYVLQSRVYLLFYGKITTNKFKSENEVKIYDESELCVTWGKSSFKVSHCRGLYHWILVFDSCYVYGVCVCNLRPLSTMIY